MKSLSKFIYFQFPLFFVILLCVCCEVIAQRKSFTKVDSALVRFNLDSLIFPSGHQFFDTLYQHLNQINEDKGIRPLRVLHIGGSHVQAGMLTGRLRNNLQELIPQYSVNRGMMFPYSVMKTNGPSDYRFTATGKWTRCRNVERTPSQSLGLSGAAVTTTDLTSSLELQHSSLFHHVLLYGSSLVDSAAVVPVLVVDEDTLFADNINDKQRFDFHLSRPVDHCKVLLTGDSCGAFTFRGMIVDLDSCGIFYTASGINGASLPSWLRCDLFQIELQPIVPDLAILAIGINDANVLDFSSEQFKQSYRQLIDRIRFYNPNCALLFITNNDCYLRVGRHRYYNKNTEKAEQAFLELAEEYNGAVWNLYRLMGGFKSSTRWVRAKLMRADHIHFTAHGYEVLGDLLYNALLSDYEKSFSSNVKDE